MTVGIVGLGLIGGSFAKAYSDNDEHRVLAYNRSKQVIQDAYEEKAIDGELNEKNYPVTITKAKLMSGVIFDDYTPIIKLGI